MMMNVMGEITNFYNSIFKGLSLKEVTLTLLIIIFFYAVMTGKGLVSRVLQVLAIVVAWETFFKYYDKGDIKGACIQSGIIVCIFFAPVIIKYLYRTVKYLVQLISAFKKGG